MKGGGKDRIVRLDVLTYGAVEVQHLSERKGYNGGELRYREGNEQKTYVLQSMQRR